MRIAIDTLFENPDRTTGAIDYLRNLVKALPQAGPQHEYFLLTSDRNIRHFIGLDHPRIHFVRCFYSNENLPLRILLQHTLVPVLLRKNKIDALFAAGGACPFWGQICTVVKINTLHHYHSPQLIGRSRTLYRRYSSLRSAQRATHIVANTEMTKRDICTLMYIPEAKVSVVSEPMYDVYVPVLREHAGEILRKHGLDRRYILFVSSLYAYKNTDTLIKAFRHVVKQRGLDVELVIVGRDFDSQLPKLRSLAEEAGVADNVRFLGFVPTEDLPALYSSAEVFVFPSLVETFGKPLVEAMRCGVPVVASNTSCIPEVAGGAALLVNPLDSVEMAAAIVQVMDRGPLREDLIKRGLERAKDFSSEDTTKQTVRLIEDAFGDWKASHGHSRELAGDAQNHLP